MLVSDHERPEVLIPRARYPVKTRRIIGLFFWRTRMNKKRRWEIGLCDRGNVHLHYGTGSLNILRDDFVDLALELQQLANRLNVACQENETQNKKGLLQ